MLLNFKASNLCEERNRQNKREKQEPFKIKNSDKKYRDPKLEPMMSCGLMPTHYELNFKFRNSNLLSVLRFTNLSVRQKCLCGLKRTQVFVFSISKLLRYLFIYYI